MYYSDMICILIFYQIVGERMIETDTKYEDIEENMGKNIKIPRKDGSNVSFFICI